MFKKSLLMMLFVALMAPWAAAQTSLFSEDFETMTSLTDAGWTTDGPGTWELGTGDYSTSTGSGHGSKNALIKHKTSNNVTKLITPAIDLSSVNSAELSFMYINRNWGTTDELRVYYRTSSSGDWTKIFETTTAHALWQTAADINLPNLSSTYQLAFEMTDNYGYGIGIDYINITEGACCPKPTDLAITLTEGNGSIATFSWTKVGLATTYTLQYGTDSEFATNTTEVTNTFTVSGTTVSFVATTGLTPEAVHYARVKANCTSCDDNSEWSSVISFIPTNCVTHTINSPKTNTNAYFPIHYNTGSYNSLRCQFIISSSAIEEAMQWGEIRRLTFYNSTNTISYGNAKYNVYVGKVDDGTSLSIQYVNWSTLTQVATNAAVTVNNNVMEIVFATPFVYDGGNLLIGFYQTAAGSNATYSDNMWEGVTGTSGNSRYNYNNSSSSSTSFLPKITFSYIEGEEPSCLPVSGLTYNAASITSTSVELNWTVGGSEESAWKLQYKKIDDENFTTYPSAITEKPFTLSGLTSNTTYDWQVAAWCDPNDNTAISTYVAGTNFKTACEVPWSDDFESYDANTVPTGWDNSASTSLTLSTTPYYIWGVYSYSDNKMIRMNNSGVKSGTALINSPIVTIPSEGAYELTFSYSHRASCGDFTVKISENGGATFSDLESYSRNSALTYNNTDPDNFIEAVISLADYAGKSIILQFFANSNNGAGAIFVDNVSIDLAPACSKPSGLTCNSSNVTAHTALLSWTAGDEGQDAWQIAYSTDPDFNPDNVTPVDANENPFTLEDLEDGQTYYAYVRGDCGEDGPSAWCSTNVSFNTPAGNLVPTSFEYGSVTSSSVIFTITGAATNDNHASFEIYCSTAEEIPNPLDDSDTHLHKGITTNTFALDELTPQTTYYAWVRDNCGEDGISEWSSPIQFETDCVAITITNETPYEQNFNSPVVTTTYSQIGVMPSCWYSDGNSSYAFTKPHIVISSDTYNYSSSQALSFYGYYSSTYYFYAVFPEFTNDLQDLMVSFNWATESSSKGTLVLGYITSSDINYNTFTSIKTFNASTTSQESMVSSGDIYLNKISESATQLVFRYYATSQYTCCVDDVVVSLLPECMPVGTLSDATGVTANSATLTWALYDDDQDKWDVQYATNSTFTENVGDRTEVASHENYELTGLNPTTHYYVRVKAHCSDNEWSNTIDFETLESCPTPTDLEASNLTQQTVDLSWDGSSDSYNIQYRVASSVSPLFEDGFENGIGEWSLVACTASYTGINTSAKRTDDYGFRFYYNSNPPQYLVSPELTGVAEGTRLEFWYKNNKAGNTNYPETFKVGTSTTNATTASEIEENFTFGSEITANDLQWHQYSEYIPAGTKYFCIKLTSNNQYYLYIDDVLVGLEVAAGEWQSTTSEENSKRLTGLTAGTKYDVKVQGVCDEETGNWCESIDFTTPSTGKVFLTEGNWGTASNWVPAVVPTSSEDVDIRANVIVEKDCVANVHNITFEGSPTPTITIAAGGQLICNNSVAVTMQKSTEASIADDPTTTNVNEAVNKWYLISSPVNTPTVSSFAQGTHNVYSYDEPTHYWIEYHNWGGEPSTATLSNGLGYLYRSTVANITFTGYSNVGLVDYTLGFTGDETNVFRGFNLIGNPYPHNIYKGVAILNSKLESQYCILNPNGTWTLTNDNVAIAPGQAVLVQATSAGDIEISDDATAPGSKYGNDNIWFTVKNNEFTDVACVEFKEGHGFNKPEHRNENAPMLYIMNNGVKFASANMPDNTSVINLGFEAKTMGQYTISLKAEGQYSYMHLFDKLTGEDIDMLVEDSYTFVGSQNDRKDRFVLRLNYNAAGIDTESDIFAYQSGDDIIVSGEGELQVFDVTGRKVMTMNVNGVETVNGFNKGVYIFRMEGKTQKIVIR